ncbi:helix-turn-helix domain-containing protein [Chryseobacterium populi]|uniref:DNA-binding domain-containing protein, AraC-type n=1 Tax=Chryseobacterium populi TaxID=1144316 RepID=J2T9P3_9FLAO|nr:helix-turn-helix domain-containing protein [Chryseobacterium populi]EJL74842.1 DNA-binding domain-containing protein, AraC-type [Chryseobacterium populi]
MQNANAKCGLIEENKGFYTDKISNEAFVWYEKNWKHDEYDHLHERAQLTYVEEGYQYFHIDQKIYLVPKNHVIWIPSDVKHRTTSEAKTVNLMLILFKLVFKKDFFQSVHVFPAPPVLKEMLLYASKWNKVHREDEEQTAFMKALLISLPNFCDESCFLEIPVPADQRLVPVCHYINSHYQYNLKVDDLADMAKMSVRSLQRIFKQETGITLQKYHQLIRILKSIELIDAQQYTLSEIAFRIGYKSLSAFTNSYVSVMKTGPKTKK